MIKKRMDMTVGSPFKLIFLFTLPIIVNNILSQLYSLADSTIVALALGNDAVTGVNLTGSVTFLILGFANGCAAGFGIVMAQFVGSKNESGMRKTLFAALFLTFLIGITLSAITLPVARKILLLLKTNEKYIDYSVSYINTALAGIVFTMLSNLSSQLLLAMGDSKSPVFILITSAVLNVGLNSLLFLFDWGVAWAGWATIISQCGAAIVGFIVLFKRFPVLRLKKEDLQLSRRIVLRNLGTALPMAFQFSVTAIGCMIQQRAFNMFPPEYAMGQTTGDRINSIAISGLFNAFGASVATYMGQNYGANRTDRLKQGLRSGFAVGGILTVIATIGTIVLTPFASKLLLPDASEAVYKHVLTYTSIHAVSFVLLLLISFSRNALQGIGKSIFSTCGGILELISRIICSLTIARHSYPIACLSNPIAWFPAGVFLTVCFCVFINKMIKNNASAPKRISSEEASE